MGVRLGLLNDDASKALIFEIDSAKIKGVWYSLTALLQLTRQITHACMHEKTQDAVDTANTSDNSLCHTSYVHYNIVTYIVTHIAHPTRLRLSDYSYP